MGLGSRWRLDSRVGIDGNIVVGKKLICLRVRVEGEGYRQVWQSQGQVPVDQLRSFRQVV
jgi:hypothetical protein